MATTSSKAVNGISYKSIIALVAAMAMIATIHATFVVPGILNAASDRVEERLDRHNDRMHEQIDQRLDRIESKLDRLIEKVK